MTKRKRPNLPALQRKWYARLARAGFDDIEGVSGDLRGHGATVPFDDNEDIPAPGGLTALSAPYDHLAAAYWRYPWAHPTDRAICKLLSEGVQPKIIQRRLDGAGRDRIKAVIRAVAQWTDSAAFDA